MSYVPGNESARSRRSSPCRFRIGSRGLRVLEITSDAPVSAFGGDGLGPLGWGRWLAVLLLMAGVGCANHQVEPGSGLSLRGDQFRSRFETLCLAQTQLGFHLEEGEARRISVEDEIAAQLESAGLAIVRAERLNAVRTRIEQEFGGYFDPDWGRVIEEKRAAIQAAVHRAMQSELACDGLVESAVLVVDAGVGGQIVRWDHRERFLAYPIAGVVPAISVEVAIRDTPESEVYYGVGGIQLAMAIREDKFTEAHFEPLDDAALLAAPGDIRTGVALALEDLRLGLGFPRASRERRRRER